MIAQEPWRLVPLADHPEAIPKLAEWFSTALRVIDTAVRAGRPLKIMARAVRGRRPEQDAASPP